MDISSVIRIQFNCSECENPIEAVFKKEQLTVVHCPACSRGYTLMKPTIGEEILIDWENEALFQKVRAEKNEHDKTELIALIVKVIELLTWRDEGNGHVRAIETLREWLLSNGVPKALIELLDAKGRRGSPPFERHD